MNAINDTMSERVVNNSWGRMITTEKFDFYTIANGEMFMKNDTKLLQAQLVMYDVLIPIFGLLIIIANLLVVISSGLLLKKGQEPRCTYMLLGNVAFADLITGLMVVTGSVIPQTVSFRNHTTCCIFLGGIIGSTIASIYSVALIAVDRFLYILHGLKYHKHIYMRRIWSMIGATWFIGILIGYLPLMGWAGDSLNGHMCWYTMVFPKELIFLTSILGCIPIIFVTVLYSIILYRAIKKVIQLRGASKHNGAMYNTKLRMFRGGKVKDSIKTISEKIEESNNSSFNTSQQSLQSNSVASLSGDFLVENTPGHSEYENVKSQDKTSLPTKWKAVKVVLFITGSFVCTWVPYLIACAVYVFCDADKTPQHCRKLQFTIASPLAILGFVNSLLNPIIYAWWNNGFRTFVKKMYWKKKKLTVMKCKMKKNQVIN